MNQVTVRLYDEIGTGLVILCSSGVFYSNQSGGTACLHPSIEGIYVPIANDIDANGTRMGPAPKLETYFIGPPHRGSGAFRGIDKDDANEIDAILSQYADISGVKVDRERLKSSHEAWVYVTVSHQVVEELVQGLPEQGQYGAILTWPNSD